MLLWCRNVQWLNTSQLWQARPIVAGSVVPCSFSMQFRDASNDMAEL